MPVNRGGSEVDALLSKDVSALATTIGGQRRALRAADSESAQTSLAVDLIDCAARFTRVQSALSRAPGPRPAALARAARELIGASSDVWNAGVDAERRAPSGATGKLYRSACVSACTCAAAGVCVGHAVSDAPCDDVTAAGIAYTLARAVRLAIECMPQLLSKPATSNFLFGVLEYSKGMVARFPAPARIAPEAAATADAANRGNAIIGHLIERRREAARMARAATMELALAKNDAPSAARAVLTAGTYLGDAADTEYALFCFNAANGLRRLLRNAADGIGATVDEAGAKRIAIALLLVGDAGLRHFTVKALESNPPDETLTPATAPATGQPVNAVTLRGAVARLHGGRAAALEFQGKLEEAIAATRAARRLSDNTEEAERELRLAIALAPERREEAFQIAVKTAAVFRTPGTAVALAMTLAMSGDVKHALDLLSAAQRTVEGGSKGVGSMYFTTLVHCIDTILDPRVPPEDCEERRVCVATALSACDFAGKVLIAYAHIAPSGGENGVATAREMCKSVISAVTTLSAPNARVALPPGSALDVAIALLEAATALGLVVGADAHAELHAKGAWCHLGVGRIPAAFQAAAAANAIAPTSAAAVTALAVLYVATADDEEALAAVARLPSATPSRNVAQCLLSLVSTSRVAKRDRVWVAAAKALLQLPATPGVADDALAEIARNAVAAARRVNAASHANFFENYRRRDSAPALQKPAAQSVAAAPPAKAELPASSPAPKKQDSVKKKAVNTNADVTASPKQQKKSESKTATKSATEGGCRPARLAANEPTWRWGASQLVEAVNAARAKAASGRWAGLPKPQVGDALSTAGFPRNAKALRKSVVAHAVTTGLLAEMPDGALVAPDDPVLAPALAAAAEAAAAARERQEEEAEHNNNGNDDDAADGNDADEGDDEGDEVEEEDEEAGDDEDVDAEEEEEEGGNDAAAEVEDDEQHGSSSDASAQEAGPSTPRQHHDDEQPAAAATPEHFLFGPPPPARGAGGFDGGIAAVPPADAWERANAVAPSPPSQRVAPAPAAGAVVAPDLQLALASIQDSLAAWCTDLVTAPPVTGLPEPAPLDSAAVLAVGSVDATSGEGAGQSDGRRRQRHRQRRR